MRLDKLTVKAQEAVQAAQSLADQDDHQAIEPEHLLLALLQQQEGVVGAAARQARRASGDDLGASSQAELPRLPKVQRRQRRSTRRPRFEAVLEPRVGRGRSGSRTSTSRPSTC